MGDETSHRGAPVAYDALKGAQTMRATVRTADERAQLPTSRLAFSIEEADNGENISTGAPARHQGTPVPAVPRVKGAKGRAS
jgi:hypothetical protein